MTKMSLDAVKIFAWYSVMQWPTGFIFQHIQLIFCGSDLFRLI